MLVLPISLLRLTTARPGALETHLRESLESVDVLITTGGVSMGELDLLKPTIERSLKGTIHFGRVSMKPGKPTTFGTVPLSALAGSGTSADTRYVAYRAVIYRRVLTRCL